MGVTAAYFDTVFNVGGWVAYIHANPGDDKTRQRYTGENKAITDEDFLRVG